MQEHVIYGSQGSGSAVAELALEWAGLPFRVVSAAQWEPGPGLEALKAVNPLGQIPTLVLPGGTVNRVLPFTRRMSLTFINSS